MRDKIIKRFAAGTIGICFAYALIRQPFAVLRNPDELITPSWSTATESTTQPGTLYPVTTVPATVPTETLTEVPSTIAETSPSTEPVTEEPETEAVTEEATEAEPWGAGN